MRADVHVVPGANHVQYRLTAEGAGTRLVFFHRAMGLILPEHRDGMPKGWEYWLERIRERAERKNRNETKRSALAAMPPATFAPRKDVLSRSESRRTNSAVLDPNHPEP